MAVGIKVEFRFIRFPSVYSIYRVNVAALNATATVVGIRQNVTLGEQNKIGHHSWQRHHTQTGKYHTHASSI